MLVDKVNDADRSAVEFERNRVVYSSSIIRSGKITSGDLGCDEDNDEAESKSGIEKDASNMGTSNGVNMASDLRRNNALGNSTKRRNAGYCINPHKVTHSCTQNGSLPFKNKSNSSCMLKRC